VVVRPPGVRRRRKATIAAYLVAVAYALGWPIASAAAFDFHEVAFAPVLMAVALERLQAGRLRTALIALAALLLVKEDMGLFVAGIGGYLAVARPRQVSRQRLVALALVVLGVADTWVATYVLIPAFGGRSDYYWAYGVLGSNVPQAAGHIVAHPVGTLRLLITPRVKLDTMLWLLAPFCFLPLLSPITIAVIPLLAERMLQDKFPNWWLTAYHYNAYLVIILACGAVDGAVRLDRWVSRAKQARAAAAPRDSPRWAHRYGPGDSFCFPGSGIHRMYHHTEAVTIHVYSPPLRAIGYYEVVDGLLQRTPGPPDEASPESPRLLASLAGG